MRVCIVGGGKVGYYLAKTLYEHGHTPLVIEEETSTCRQLADWLDLAVIHGDGTTMDVLSSADLASCQALVAVTGRDENNLVACQLAKQVFKVKKTVARVNNPKNAEVLKLLGVDIAVSSTDNITRLIEREVETVAIHQLLSLADGTTTLTEITIPPDFPFDGMTLAQIKSVPDTVVISVSRNGQVIIPQGGTRICADDKIMVLAKSDAFRTFSRQWRLMEDRK